MAEILSRERFDSRPPRICKKSRSLDAPGRPGLAGFMTAPGTQAEGVSVVTPPPPNAPAANSRPRLVGASVPDPERVRRTRL